MENGQWWLEHKLKYGKEGSGKPRSRETAAAYIKSANVVFLKCNLSSGFPGGTSGKEPPCHAGGIRDVALIPGSGRSPGGGHHNPLQYSCLENPMDRGAWWATVHGIAKSWTWLSIHTRRTKGEIMNWIKVTFKTYEHCMYKLMGCSQKLQLFQSFAFPFEF